MSIAPETKSADPAADASRAFDEFARAFEAFKETNDSRLSRIETRLSGDVVTEEKLARIGDVLDEHTRRIDRVTLDARRPALAGAAADARDPAVAEHKAAFDALCAGRRSRRAEAPRGEGAVGRLRAGRRLSGARRDRARGAAAACGDLADPRHRLGAHDLGRALQEAVLDHRRRGRLGRRDRGAAADQCRDARRALLPGDGALRHAGGDADAPRRRRRQHRRSGSPREVEPAFAEQEGAAFVNGDGVNKPKGFLASDTVANGAWVWGKLGYRARPAPPAPSRP